METGRDDDSGHLIDFRYDHDQIEGPPISGQLRHHVSRDPCRGKLYSIGQRMFGDMHTGTRVINAMGAVDSRSVVAASSPSFTVFMSETRTSSTATDPVKMEMMVKSQTSAMQIWIKERKAFRQRFDAMGLNEFLLQHKADRTSMEQNVLNRMKAERLQKPAPPPMKEELPLETVLPREMPVFKRPSPLAIQIIQDFLRQNQMRLIDLFRTVDVNRKWLISRKDFSTTLNQAKVPISEALMEDLISTLDDDFNDLLDYRELAAGMGLWSAEKRNTKKKVLPDITRQEAPRRVRLELPLKRHAVSPSSIKSPIPVIPPIPSTHRIKSAASVMSITAERTQPEPQRLIISAEQTIAELQEHTLLEKPHLSTVDRSADLKLSVPPIKTGDLGILKEKYDRLPDCDLKSSTILLRDQIFVEYSNILKLCRQRGVILSESLLRKALIHPPDNSHPMLLQKLQDPHYKYLLSRNPDDPYHVSQLAVRIPKKKREVRRMLPVAKEESLISTTEDTSSVTEDESTVSSTVSSRTTSDAASEIKLEEEGGGGEPTLPGKHKVIEAKPMKFIIKAKRETRLPALPKRRQVMLRKQISKPVTEPPTPSSSSSEFESIEIIERTLSEPSGTKLSKSTDQRSESTPLIQERLPHRRIGQRIDKLPKWRRAEIMQLPKLKSKSEYLSTDTSQPPEDEADVQLRSRKKRSRRRKHITPQRKPWRRHSLYSPRSEGSPLHRRRGEHAEHRTRSPQPRQRGENVYRGKESLSRRRRVSSSRFPSERRWEISPNKEVSPKPDSRLESGPRPESPEIQELPKQRLSRDDSFRQDGSPKQRRYRQTSRRKEMPRRRTEYVPHKRVSPTSERSWQDGSPKHRRYQLISRRKELPRPRKVYVAHRRVSPPSERSWEISPHKEDSKRLSRAYSHIRKPSSADYAGRLYTHSRHMTMRKERRLAKLKKYGHSQMINYPHDSDKRNEPVEMALSTGKALISTKVDCWVTFEQFKKIVDEIPGKYVHLYGPTQKNTFWPGKVLDRLRLCLDDWSPHSSSHPIFEHVTRSKLQPVLSGIPRCSAPIRPSLIQY